MSRQRYIQEPVTFKLIPAEEYVDNTPTAHYSIMPDIQPYKSVVTGEVINSRSKHREHLKAHGLVELGNEKPKPRAMPDLPGRREAIIETCRKMKIRGFN